MVLFTFDVAVRADVVFPDGASWMGVEAQTDFELRGKVADDQVRDKAWWRSTLMPTWKPARRNR